MKIAFCQNNFNSIKSVQAFIKQSVDSCEFYEIIDEKHRCFPLFSSLVQVHFNREDKFGQGIKHFYFAPNLYRKKELQIRRMDDSTVSMCCNYGKIIKGKNPHQDLRAAMRYSIADQVLKWKTQQKSPHCCQFCSKEITLIQADHIYPFSRLVNDFLNLTQYTVPTAFLKNEYNMIVFRQEDEAFEKAWKIYHNDNASFQILCIQCNTQKSDKYDEEKSPRSE